MKGQTRNKFILISVVVVFMAIILTVIIILTGTLGMKHPNQAPDNDGKVVAGVTPTEGVEVSVPAKVTLPAEKKQKPSDGIVHINIYSVDRELDEIVELYAKEHWNFKYKIDYWSDEAVLSTEDLVNLTKDQLQKDSSSVDLYCVPDVYAPMYIKGEFSDYACPYKELGIDIDAAIKKADIPSYTMECGTNSNGEIIALPYMASVSEFVYRRSVAKKVWGTDDPDQIGEILGAGTEKWDKFIEAAQTLKKHGYYIVPGCRDLSFQLETKDSDFGLVTDKNIEVNPEWNKFIEVSKQLYDNGCITDTQAWSDQWFKDWTGKGDKVFGMTTYGDLYQYVDMGDTAGDWAVCMPPMKLLCNYNTGIMVSKNSPNKELLGPLIEWITLDSSKKGLQYRLASGTYGDGEITSVISGSVLKTADSSRDILGGQNINPVIYNILQGSHKKRQLYASPLSNRLEELLNEIEANQ